MKAIITPAPLRGSVELPASKSQAHRLLICASLADRSTQISCSRLSEDIQATADCLRALGAKIEYSGGVFSVDPIQSLCSNARLDCGESGSTLRFLLPVVCALGCGAEMKMHGRLPARPLSPLWEELERCGAVLSRPTHDRISVSGRLAKRDFVIAGNVSSQFISGLLFALPLLGGGSIAVEGRLESANYIEMSLQALERFGIHPEKNGGVYNLESEKYSSPESVIVEGDWSAAAFWLVADALCGGVQCGGLAADSRQGDRAAPRLIREIKAGGAVIDSANVPDLVPALAVLAALTPGRTEFINAARLRLKESDRIASVCSMLKGLGADICESEQGLVIYGKTCLLGGITRSHGDHRIAMAAAVAAIGCRGEVIIENAQAVNKSYPDFWEDYVALGGKLRLEESK